MWNILYLQMLAATTAAVSAVSTHSCKAWPGTPSWPPGDSWAALNDTVQGRLVAVVPPAAPCHRSFNGHPTYDAALCRNLTSDWTLQPTHYQNPVSMMNDVYTNLTCLTTDNPDIPCTIGSYPVYVIKAETVADIQAGVAFARSHNVRLVIKNTGHDFMGRSVGSGSLSIWTHQFDEMRLTNYSSPGYTGSAVRLGAGVLTGNVYDFLDKAGQVFVAGECQSVGFSGGYIQGGGHGPLSTLYGMGSDQALEFTLVTADGKHITASPTSYSDLFWALRGGGPAAWGVVTSVTVKTFPTLKVAGAVINFGTMNPDIFWSGIDAFHAATPGFIAAGMYAYYTLSVGGNFLLKPLLAPGKTAAQLSLVIAPLLANLDSRAVNYTIEVSEHPTFLAGYRALFDGEPAGGSFLTSSRLFQKEHIQNNNSAITAAMRSLIDGGLYIIGHMVGPGQNGGVQNAVNPAWKTGILLPLTNRFFTANTTLGSAIADQIPLDNVLKAASPGSGTYLNEANIFDPEWKDAFWGSNYPRLHAIKTKYDPAGVFWAKTSVGSDTFTEVAGRLCRA